MRGAAHLGYDVPSGVEQQTVIVSETPKRRVRPECWGFRASTVRTVSGYSSDMESELITFHPGELALYHRNPRLGDVKIIADSLRAHGQYKPVVVNRGTHTGRANEVLAGNHTVKAFRDLLEAEPDNDAWTRVQGYVIDVDDDRARRIVLVDNRSAELGGYDNAALADLLGDLGDLTGTGYTEDDLSDLMAGIEELVTSPDDGLIPNVDIEDKADRYSDVSTRVIVLQYPISQFIWMQDKLGDFRKEAELETNSDAIRLLVEQWCGETAPEPSEETDEPTA